MPVLKHYAVEASPDSLASRLGGAVSLSLRVANGREIPRYDVQLEADGSLSMRSGLGGSCAGAANTGRAATFVYRRAR